MGNFSNLTNATQAPPSTSPPLYGPLQEKLLMAYYIILILATVAGNTLVCVAIYFDRRLRSPTNWFIASLAVSDLMYGLIGLSFRVANASGLSLELCRFWIWADMCSAAASMANLAVISVDRYLKISKPFSYGERMTTRRSLVAITGVWFYAAVLASLSIVPMGDEGVIHDDFQFCKNENKYFYTIANTVAFIIPLTIVVVSYLLIYRTALKQFNKMQNVTMIGKLNREESKKQRRTAKDFKATKTLAVVIGTFTICWFPFFLIFTITLYVPMVLLGLSHPWNVISISVFVLILPNLNSACNPVIYAYFNSDYRRAFKKIVTSTCQLKKLNFDYNKKRRSSASFFHSMSQQRRGSPQDHALMAKINGRDCAGDTNTANGTAIV